MILICNKVTYVILLQMNQVGFTSNIHSRVIHFVTEKHIQFTFAPNVRFTMATSEFGRAAMRSGQGREFRNNLVWLVDAVLVQVNVIEATANRH